MVIENDLYRLKSTYYSNKRLKFNSPFLSLPFLLVVYIQLFINMESRDQKGSTEPSFDQDGLSESLNCSSRVCSTKKIKKMRPRKTISAVNHNLVVITGYENGKYSYKFHSKTTKPEKEMNPFSETELKEQAEEFSLVTEKKHYQQENDIKSSQGNTTDFMIMLAMLQQSCLQVPNI